jgi:hypothetical protein
MGEDGELAGAPYGIRTRVAAVKGRCPRPLDEGRIAAPGRAGARMATYKEHRRQPQGCRPVGRYQWPVFFMDAHGSCGGFACPLCKSSIEWLSGERTKAMVPSRGGRLMVTPAFISRSQVA